MAFTQRDLYNRFWYYWQSTPLPGVVIGMKYLRQSSVVQTDRTVLVIMGDVFPLSAGIFSGIF